MTLYPLRDRAHRLRRAATLLSAALTFATGAHCQVAANAAPTFTAGPVYTSTEASKGSDAGPRYPDVDIVLRNGGGRMPQAAELTLLEPDGKTVDAKAVHRFDELGYGIDAITAIDASGSMRGSPLAIVRDSLYRFVSQARSQDRLGVVSFADDMRWEARPDASRDALRASLEHLTSRGQLTRMYDGLLQALDSFDDSLPRRELIVISDGHDEGSRHTLQDVIAAAQRRRIPVDAIGLTQSSPLYLRNLQRLAAATGGQFRQAHSDAELQALISNSIGSIKAQPVATFRAQDLPRDGEEHTLSVHWLPDLGTAPVIFPALAKEKMLDRLLHGSAPMAWYLGLGACICLLLAGAWMLRPKRSGTAASVDSATPAVAVPPVQAAGQGRFDHTGTESAFHVSERSGFSAPPFRRPTPQMDASSAASGQATPVIAPGRTGLVSFFDPNHDGVLGVLHVLDGPYAGQQIRVTSPRFQIGALFDNQLVIPGDPTLSGHHATLLFTDRIWMIEDNGSTNGTFLNGQRCTERRPLSAGDELRMGRSVFRVTPA